MRSFYVTAGTALILVGLGVLALVWLTEAR